jgi:predicted amidohydrolase YtcJ
MKYARPPTLAEINAAAPDTPVFVLHLYARAMLNAAALRAVGYTKDTPEPVGGTMEHDARGNLTGMLIARPNTAILCATLARGPKLPVECQPNSTRHFMRELNRLGVTSVRSGLSCAAPTSSGESVLLGEAMIEAQRASAVHYQQQEATGDRDILEKHDHLDLVGKVGVENQRG